MRIFKFRVWNTRGQCWYNPNILEVATEDGKLGAWYEQTEYIVQQWTGLKSKDGYDIYEGDIIKFVYTVGDFAREEMDKDEIEESEKLCGEEMTGTVVWGEALCGFYIILKRDHAFTFPMYYGRIGQIVGNIFES